MLAKVVKLRNERGGAVSAGMLVDYLSREQAPLSQEEKALRALGDYVARDGVSGNREVVGGTFNLEGLDVAAPEDRELATQLMDHVARVGRVKNNAKTNPFYHFILSWKENEQPTQKQAQEAVKRSMDALGMKENQAFFVIHRDTDIHHVHVVVNRYHPEKLVLNGPPRFDFFVLDKVCREVELAQGWGHAPGPHVVIDGQIQRLSKAQRKSLGLIDGVDRAPTPAARMAEKHTGIPALADWLNTRAADQLVAVVERDGATWADLHYALAERGVRAEMKGGGLVFTARTLEGQETSTKASGVNYKLSLGRLEKTLGQFRLASDLPPPTPGKTYAEFAKNVLTGVEPGLEYPGRTGSTPERQARREERQADREALLKRYQDEKEMVKRTAKDRGQALREAQKTERQDLLDRLRQDKPSRIEALEREHGSRAVARGLWAAERAVEIEAMAVKHKAESADMRKGNRMEWPDWLKRQAELGDHAAVSALRGLKYREQRKANKSRSGFEGEELEDEIKPSTSSKPRGDEGRAQVIVGGIGGQLAAFSLAASRYEVDPLRDRIIYRDGQGQARLTDQGHRVDVHHGVQDTDAMRAGLKLASQKFGGDVYITGSAEFRAEAAREAVRIGVKVADQDLQPIVAEERQRMAADRFGRQQGEIQR